MEAFRTLSGGLERPNLFRHNRRAGFLLSSVPTAAAPLLPWRQPPLARSPPVRPSVVVVGTSFNYVDATGLRVTSSAETPVSDVFRFQFREDCINMGVSLSYGELVDSISYSDNYKTRVGFEYKFYQIIRDFRYLPKNTLFVEVEHI